MDPFVQYLLDLVNPAHPKNQPQSGGPGVHPPGSYSYGQMNQALTGIMPMPPMIAGEVIQGPWGKKAVEEPLDYLDSWLDTGIGQVKRQFSEAGVAEPIGKPPLGHILHDDPGGNLALAIKAYKENPSRLIGEQLRSAIIWAQAQGLISKKTALEYIDKYRWR